jgi:hypothetical protein
MPGGKEAAGSDIRLLICLKVPQKEGEFIHQQRKPIKNRNMKKYLSLSLVALSMLIVFGCSAFGGELEDLAGKWSVKKTNANGQAYSQVLEFKKEKFVFKMVGSEEKVFLHAEGDVKLEKLGPFKSIKFFNIKAGASADELESVDDDRTSIYILDGSTITLASNFDKERDKGPGIEVYTKAGK